MDLQCPPSADSVERVNADECGKHIKDVVETADPSTKKVAWSANKSTGVFNLTEYSLALFGIEACNPENRRRLFLPVSALSNS